MLPGRGTPLFLEAKPQVTDRESYFQGVQLAQQWWPTLAAFRFTSPRGTRPSSSSSSTSSPEPLWEGRQPKTQAGQEHSQR